VLPVKHLHSLVLEKNSLILRVLFSNPTNFRLYIQIEFTANRTHFNVKHAYPIFREVITALGIFTAEES
jgi:hypothetical protein